MAKRSLKDQRQDNDARLNEVMQMMSADSDAPYAPGEDPSARLAEKENPDVGPHAEVPIIGDDRGETDYLEGELAFGPNDMPIDAWDEFKTGRRTDNILEEQHGPRGYQVFLDDEYIPRFVATEGPMAWQPVEIGSDGSYDEYDVLDALEFAYDPDAMEAWDPTWNFGVEDPYGESLPGDVQQSTIDFSVLDVPSQMALTDDEMYSILTGGQKRDVAEGSQPMPMAPSGPLGPKFQP